MPTGEPCIICNLRDDPLRLYDSDDLERSDTYGLVLLSGARTKPFVIHNQQQDRVFGIQFHSAGAFAFFEEPASEMENHAVPLDLLWRNGAGELRERLLAAPSVGAMFRSAESVLLAHAARPFALHPAVGFALRRFSAEPYIGTVGEVTGELGLSRRRFIQVFHKQVGLTPKAFCRVRRFQYVLQSISNAQQVDWADVALASGYYDQAHFIHDFRSFSSLTPRQYWANRTEHLKPRR